jgi:hypothetical protein
VKRKSRIDKDTEMKRVSAEKTRLQEELLAQKLSSSDNPVSMEEFNKGKEKT